MAYIRTCVQNLGEIRRPVRNNCPSITGLPGFARDNFSIMMSICALHFYIIYFNFFCADHGIPQTFDETLMPATWGIEGSAPWGIEGLIVFSRCPFPDESADVYQMWCQSVQLFGILSRLLGQPVQPFGRFPDF